MGGILVCLQWSIIESRGGFSSSLFKNVRFSFVNTRLSWIIFNTPTILLEEDFSLLSSRTSDFHHHHHVRRHYEGISSAKTPQPPCLSTHHHRPVYKQTSEEKSSKNSVPKLSQTELGKRFGCPASQVCRANYNRELLNNKVPVFQRRISEHRSEREQCARLPTQTNRRSNRGRLSPHGGADTLPPSQKGGLQALEAVRGGR